MPVAKKPQTIKEKEMISSHVREVNKEVARVIAGATGYLIRTPVYKTPGALLIPADIINVHPHKTTDGKKVKGGVIKLSEGQGHTENEAWAKWVAQEWEDYKVLRVDADRSVFEYKKFTGNTEDGEPTYHYEWVKTKKPLDVADATGEVRTMELAGVVDGS